MRQSVPERPLNGQRAKMPPVRGWISAVLWSDGRGYENRGRHLRAGFDHHRLRGLFRLRPDSGPDIADLNAESSDPSCCNRLKAQVIRAPFGTRTKALEE